jgi:hypothetical protein
LTGNIHIRCATVKAETRPRSRRRPTRAWNSAGQSHGTTASNGLRQALGPDGDRGHGWTPPGRVPRHSGQRSGQGRDVAPPCPGRRAADRGLTARAAHRRPHTETAAQARTRHRRSERAPLSPGDRAGLILTALWVGCCRCCAPTDQADRSSRPIAPTDRADGSRPLIAPTPPNG